MHRRNARSTLAIGITLTLLAQFVAAQGNPAEANARCQSTVRALREVLLLPAAESAAKSAAEGDLRYLEWFGIAGAVPAVRSQECARREGTTKPFLGTSDVLCSHEHRELYEKSYPFAEAYNRQMVLERRQRGAVTCDDA